MKNMQGLEYTDEHIRIVLKAMVEVHEEHPKILDLQVCGMRCMKAL